jgi:hypothetical protein
VNGRKLPKPNYGNRRPLKISFTAKLADTSRDLPVTAPPHRLRGSCLAINTVLMTVGFVLQAATSLRASQACFDLVVTLQGGLPFESASHTTIQNWILRIGLYVLQRPKEFADDWIWIVDHTIQIGPIKVLLILGIRRSKWIQLHRPLVPTDLEVLELLPVEISNGEVVCEQYAAVARRSGVPQAILSDQGSDLQRGLKLMQNKHPDVIGLSDVTHKVASLLKALLESDEVWMAFKTRCGTTKAAIQQTPLAHLVPPKFKTKARYMNVSEQSRWGQTVCSLLQRHRAGTLSATQQADLPADLLNEKLGWVESWADSLAVWSELINLGQQACSLVRRWGYARGVAEQVDETLPVAVTERGRQLRSQLIEFVRTECAKLPSGRSFPGSSEVIESLIGKGKRLEGQQSQSGFTRYVLGLAASVATPTASLLESVSETVGIKHLTQWLTEHLPPSLQSKRLRDLGRRTKEQKQDNPNAREIATF